MGKFIFWVAMMLAAVAGRGQVVEYVGGEHKRLNPVGGDAPALGAWVTNDAGMRMRRVTDLGQIDNVSTEQEGDPTRGNYVPYASYPNDNGELFFVFNWQAGRGAIYKIDGTFVRFFSLMAPLNQGWPQEAHSLRFTEGNKVALIHPFAGGGNESSVIIEDVVTGDYQVIETGASTRINSYGCASADGRYYPVRWLESCGVLDTVAGKMLDLKVPVSTALDISPDGRWAMADGFDRVRIYSIERLGEYVEFDCISHGHAAWSILADGRNAYCAMSNKTDQFCAWVPDGKETIVFDNMGLWRDWSVGYHVSRIESGALAGWCAVSTYAAKESSWIANQLYLIELKPLGRVVRLGSTCTRWAGEGDDKQQWYFAEAQASVSRDGRRLYWGSNWSGADNLEVYQMDLGPVLALIGADGSGGDVAGAGDAQAGTEPGAGDEAATGTLGGFVDNTGWGWNDGVGVVNVDDAMTTTGAQEPVVIDTQTSETEDVVVLYDEPSTGTVEAVLDGAGNRMEIRGPVRIESGGGVTVVTW